MLANIKVCVAVSTAYTASKIALLRLSALELAHSISNLQHSSSGGDEGGEMAALIPIATALHENAEEIKLHDGIISPKLVRKILSSHLCCLSSYFSYIHV